MKQMHHGNDRLDCAHTWTDMGNGDVYPLAKKQTKAVAAYFWNWCRSLYVCIVDDRKHVTKTHIRICRLYNYQFSFVPPSRYSGLFQCSQNCAQYGRLGRSM